MNIIEAIKSGRPFRRQQFTNWYTGIGMGDLLALDRDYRYPLCEADLLADDWEIQERKVEITARQFVEACDEVLTQLYDRRIAREPFDWEILLGLLEKLGLKEEPK